MVFGWDISKIVKKKNFLSSKDKKDWDIFTQQMNDISVKESDIPEKIHNNNEIRKLDLHGLSLDDANKKVKEFIIKSFNRGYKKLLIITGKGIRSKSQSNPYISEKFSVLKYAVPEFIKNDDDLNMKVSKTLEVNRNEGAIYIFFKKESGFIK